MFGFPRRDGADTPEPVGNATGCVMREHVGWREFNVISDPPIHRSNGDTKPPRYSGGSQQMIGVYGGIGRGCASGKFCLSHTITLASRFERDAL
jgi:hypothetical protein